MEFQIVIFVERLLVYDIYKL